jgi:hypothetical protein
VRLIAIHDEEGRISMLLTSPANAPSGEQESAPGQIKTEVDTSSAGIKHGDSTTVDRLKEIIDSYRVERGKTPQALGRLTRSAAR